MRVLEAAELIVHTGDFTAASVLDELRGYGPVAAVHGNVDEPGLRGVLPERAVIEHEGLAIGIVHDAGPRAGRYERLLGWFPGCNLVAYGHTHAPEVALSEGAWIVNPGSPTERRRAPARTLAVVRERRPELVTLS